MAVVISNKDSQRLGNHVGVIGAPFELVAAVTVILGSESDLIHQAALQPMKPNYACTRTEARNTTLMWFLL